MLLISCFFQFFSTDVDKIGQNWAKMIEGDQSLLMYNIISHDTIDSDDRITIIMYICGTGTVPAGTSKFSQIQPEKSRKLQISMEFSKKRPD